MNLKEALGNGKNDGAGFVFGNSSNHHAVQVKGESRSNKNGYYMQN